MCFVNIYMYNIALQNMDFGVLQKSSRHFLIYIFFPPFSFRTPPPPFKKYTKIRTNLFYNFVVKCVLSIYLYNIALRNTNLGVPQKSSKHFLISIFFPDGEGGHPLPDPPPARHFVPRTRVSPLFITIHAPPPLPPNPGSATECRLNQIIKSNCVSDGSEMKIMIQWVTQSHSSMWFNLRPFQKYLLKSDGCPEMCVHILEYYGYGYIIMHQLWQGCLAVLSLFVGPFVK